MSRSALALALAALVFSACQSSSSKQGGPVAPGATIAIHDQAGNAGPLRLSSLKQLGVDVAYQGDPGTHALRLAFIAPNGQLYTAVPATLEADSGGVGSASQALEVAGTPIEGYHMTGIWQVTLSVDRGPILASASVDVVE